MKTKINLPTKITIARIILAFLLLLTIFTLYIVDYFSPFIYQLVISINSNVHINYLNLILLAIFLTSSETPGSKDVFLALSTSTLFLIFSSLLAQI